MQHASRTCLYQPSSCETEEDENPRTMSETLCPESHADWTHSAVNLVMTEMEPFEGVTSPATARASTLFPTPVGPVQMTIDP